MHKDALPPGARVAVLDDLLATGGTAEAQRSAGPEARREGRRVRLPHRARVPRRAARPGPGSRRILCSVTKATRTEPRVRLESAAVARKDNPQTSSGKQPLSNSVAKPSFKDMMNDVVAYGSCCECGTCVLVCPHNVIEYVDGSPSRRPRRARLRLLRDQRGHRLRRLRPGVSAAGAARVPADGAVFAEQEGPTYSRRLRLAIRRSTRRARRIRAFSSVAQDGGVVTAMLHARDCAAVASTARSSRRRIPKRPCAPKPMCATTEEEILAAAGSWYTYCPNDLALEQAGEKGCEQASRSSACPARSRRRERPSSATPEFIRNREEARQDDRAPDAQPEGSRPTASRCGSACSARRSSTSKA